MKKEVIIVPRGKCPLDFIAEMGEEIISNSWIFLHSNITDKIEEIAQRKKKDYGNESFVFMWKTKDGDDKSIDFEYFELWHKVYYFVTDDSGYMTDTSDPEYIFFLKAEE